MQRERKPLQAPNTQKELVELLTRSEWASPGPAAFDFRSNSPNYARTDKELTTK
jgi:hypothetical protein